VIAVSGMTCEHCVRAVQAEIGQLAGVTQVEVDLDSGRVTIAADPMPELAHLRAAVDAAGYELADSQGSRGL
jgi:copper chaperone